MSSHVRAATATRVRRKRGKRPFFNTLLIFAAPRRKRNPSEPSVGACRTVAPHLKGGPGEANREGAAAAFLNSRGVETASGPQCLLGSSLRAQGHMEAQTVMNIELLKALTEATGVPGREERVRALVLSELKPLCDELRVDRLGNVIAHKKGRGPKLMIAAHMDEIGFLVKYIDEEGFLRIDPVGGFDPKVLVAQRVTVHTDSGDLPGIIGSKPVHILTEEDRKKLPILEDLFVDLGSPAQTVKERAKLGDFVTLEQDFRMVGDLACCKAMDDRVGVYAMIEALRKLQSHEVDIYAVATVQEEVGLRGARVSAFDVNPDIGVALDVTVASDVPGAKKQEYVTKLGAGVAITIKDAAHIANPKMVKALCKLAEEKGIPYQLEILARGGTDAGPLQLEHGGAAVGTLSIPTRYLHSVVEAAHVKDIDACVDLLAAFLAMAHEVDYSL